MSDSEFPDILVTGGRRVISISQVYAEALASVDINVYIVIRCMRSEEPYEQGGDHYR